MKVRELRCIKCDFFSTPKDIYTCPECGSNLDVLYNYEYVKKHFTKASLRKNKRFDILRYEPILPIKRNLINNINLKVGFTPIYSSGRLNTYLSTSNVYIKDDGRNPSGSFKDRASLVGILKALEFGRNVISCASTGNAASSLSCLCASAGIKTVIFVPKDAPKPKVAQLLIFGSSVLFVDGNYDLAFDLANKSAQKYGWYNRNTGINPYLSEGKKTAALEIAEQFNWNPPDLVFVSMGDGCIIGGLYKGFKDLKDIGFIKKIPKLIGVQAKGASPIADAFIKNRPIKKIVPKTVADSIAVGMPRDGEKALRAIKHSKGFAVKVSDKEILDAQKLLARLSGVFGEPAGVASFAGFLKALKNKIVDKNKKFLILITGNGLKDIETVMKSIKTKPPIIKPKLSELKKLKNIY